MGLLKVLYIALYRAVGFFKKNYISLHSLLSETDLALFELRKRFYTEHPVRVSKYLESKIYFESTGFHVSISSSLVGL